MVTRKMYECIYCKDSFRSLQGSFWNVILTSRDAKIKNRGFPTLESGTI